MLTSRLTDGAIKTKMMNTRDKDDISFILLLIIIIHFIHMIR